MIVRFVDIGRHVIVDRHCLYFLWEGGVSELRCEVIARFVDIGRHVIVYRHCLYFLWEGGVSELRCEVIVRFVDIGTHVIVAIDVYTFFSSHRWCIG